MKVTGPVGDGPTLRPWRQSDLPVLSRLRSDAALQAQLMARPKPGDVHEWLERRSGDPRGAFFVIDEGGACSGFVQLTQIERGASAFVGICVAPERQGHGLGAAALALIEAHACQAYDVRIVKLQVLTGNQRAISLYERQGYRRVAAIADSCLMEKVA